MVCEETKMISKLDVRVPAEGGIELGAWLRKIFFVACLGSHAQHHGLVRLRARLIDQRIGTHQQATCLLRVLRTALRQIRLSGDQARVALGEAICLAARYANRLRGNLTGAPWIACARKIVGLECQYSGLVFEPCIAATGSVQCPLEEAVGLHEVSCCRGCKTLAVARDHEPVRVSRLGGDVG